jgi:hypothetical protein
MELPSFWRVYLLDTHVCAPYSLQPVISYSENEKFARTTAWDKKKSGTEAEMFR